MTKINNTFALSSSFKDFLRLKYCHKRKIRNNAEFKGNISNIKDINFTKDGSYKAIVKGTLTLHGVTKPLTVNGLITVKAGKVSATGKFPIVMKDFNIDASAVTEKVNADINAVYQ